MISSTTKTRDNDHELIVVSVATTARLGQSFQINIDAHIEILESPNGYRSIIPDGFTDS